MSGLVQKHHSDWLGYLSVTILLAALAVYACMLLKDCARTLTDWQMYR
jgi:hypothetical protein